MIGVLFAKSPEISNMRVLFKRYLRVIKPFHGILEIPRILDMRLVHSIQLILWKKLIIVLLIIVNNVGKVLIELLVGKVGIDMFPKLFFPLLVFLLQEMNLFDDFVQFGLVVVEQQLGLDELLLGRGLCLGFLVLLAFKNF